MLIAIPSQAIQTGFSLSLLCEVQDNQILPVDFEYSRNTSTYNLVSSINNNGLS